MCKTANVHNKACVQVNNHSQMFARSSFLLEELPKVNQMFTFKHLCAEDWLEECGYFGCSLRSEVLPYPIAVAMIKVPNPN